MSVTTIEENPRAHVQSLEAMLFTSLSIKDEIMQWVLDNGDEDVFFVHLPDEEHDEVDDESYILIAGDDIVSRLFLGQWLVRFVSHDLEGYVYATYDIEKFNRLFNVVEKEDGNADT